MASTTAMLTARVLETVEEPDLPVAEICRRVGAAAAAAGLRRPSYEAVRQAVRAAERAVVDGDGIIRVPCRTIVYLPEELLAQLRLRAAAQGRSQADVIRGALEREAALGA